jgi:hypothetical protein
LDAAAHRAVLGSIARAKNNNGSIPTMRIVSIAAAGHAVVGKHIRALAFVDHIWARLHEAWRHEPIVIGLGIFACMLVIVFLRKL